MTSNSLTSRDRHLDALKGVGIILMIIGHVMSPIRDVIFSFHMPLFFFISGFLYKDKSVRTIIERNSRKVLLPYVITCLVIWIVFIFKDNNWKWGISMFLANGTDTVWNFEGLMVGPLWFLICYFVAILGFHYVLKIKGRFLQFVTILSLWVVAYFIKKSYGLQPLGILNSVPAMCCLWIGYCLKEEHIKNILFSKWACIIGVIIWIFCLIYGRLSMAGLIYDLWLLQLIGALYATFLLYKIVCVKYLSRLCRGVQLVGQLSLVILCVHSIDYMLNISTTLASIIGLSYFWSITLNMLFKLIFAAIGTMIIKKTPLLSKIYE